MLTHDVLLDILEYNPENGVFQWKINPSQRIKAGDVAGTVHPHDRHIFWKRKSYSARRLAWLYMTGAWPEHDVANANGVVDDNRWDNLVPSYATERALRQHAAARALAQQPPGGGLQLPTS